MYLHIKWAQIPFHNLFCANVFFKTYNTINEISFKINHQISLSLPPDTPNFSKNILESKKQHGPVLVNLTNAVFMSEQFSGWPLQRQRIKKSLHCGAS